ncbi:flagellar protein FliS [Rickettsiales bacterium]|nr:flagellar protein FliS [Rickettsiales bacterium]
MNFNKAKKLYQKTEISSNSTKSPIELVEIMAKELNKSMNIVVNCLRKKEISKKRSKHFSRALMIIYTLQTTLDFDRGEDLAVKLFQFYEFCRKQLIKGVTQNIPECVSKAINTINQVFNDEKAENGKPQEI